MVRSRLWPRRICRLGIATGVVVGLIATGCAQQEETADTGGEQNGAASTIGVKLQEWSVVPDESSARPGEVSFDVSNVGQSDHEFMVVRTDLDLTKLPTKDDGSFDEEGEGADVIDATNAGEHGDEEHERIEAGDEKEFIYQLAEGSYVLLCNLVEEEPEDGEKETHVHFKLGMRIPFEVE